MKQKTIGDSIEETQPIFIEKDVFTVEYVPETFKYRDKQIEKIICNLKDRLSHGKRPYHMLLNGSYGTGKTLTIKHIFKEAEKEFENVKTVHINCKACQTAYMIYLKIYEKLYNKEMNVGGLSTSAVLDKIMKKIVKDDIILLIALDEVASMKNNRDLNNVLYNLLRGHETSKRARITLFPITNKRRVLFMDRDVQTVFTAIDVQFPNYTYEEIRSIINERCSLGLYKGALSSNFIDQLARICYDLGNLRKGFDEIYKAGLNAEYEGSNKIVKRHFS